MTYRPVPYVMQDIFDAVAAEYGSPVYFDYGTTTEVVNRLTLKDSNPTEKFEKYPLIWLLLNDGNIQESVTPRNKVERKAQNLTIIICTETEADYSTAERYANTIVPTLRPLYELLMAKIKSSKLVSSSTNKLEHNYYENLFWGREGLYGREGNIFNDRIDAIVINNLELLILNKC